jgi:hypothetical protein
MPTHLSAAPPAALRDTTDGTTGGGEACTYDYRIFTGEDVHQEDVRQEDISQEDMRERKEEADGIRRESVELNRLDGIYIMEVRWGDGRCRNSAGT